MADHELADLLQKQISLTEWLQAIQHPDAVELRHEDGTKAERMAAVHEIIGLPFDQPILQCPTTDLTPDNHVYKAFLATYANEMCRLRLTPTEKGLPKFRMRGKTVKDTLEWFEQQPIDRSKYRAEVVRHNDEYKWATIFIVNQHGIFGEIIYGSHALLTQGFHEGNQPIVFSYDFKQWQLDPANDDALAHVQELVSHLLVTDASKQAELQKTLGSTFSHNYLCGYYETTQTGLGTVYTDYSIALGDLYADMQPVMGGTQKGALLKGQVGCKGVATGPVMIVEPDKIDADFPDGSVLVCKVTTPDFVPLMQRAAAIVTDQGGILSHAAIVARELKVPCLVGTKTATSTLANGQLVTVDADTGVVRTS